MLITVFTPTYNRGRLLTNIYQSLLKQTAKDFEWVIVDDGSKDNTRDVVKDFMDEGKLPIVYEYQENKGKHFAVNHGVRLAGGELFFILDSDDQLMDDSLEVVAKTYQAVRNNPEIGGVSGLDCTKDGKIIGSGLPQEVIDCNALDIRYKYHVTGDLKEVFCTSVLKEIPFPEIEGERFSPEALTWNRIAVKYKLRYFNRPIYVAEYQPDGLSSRIVRIRMESPVASMMCYQEMTTYDIPLKEKVKAAINYWRFRLFAKRGVEKPKLGWYWNVFMPLGWMMYLKDKKNVEC